MLKGPYWTLLFTVLGIALAHSWKTTFTLSNSVSGLGCWEINKYRYKDKANNDFFHYCQSSSVSYVHVYHKSLTLWSRQKLRLPELFINP